MSEIVCSNCGKSQETFRGDYKYLESGLDNVTICDIETIKCSCGEESALIPRILALHKAISNCLLEKETQLTGKEIRFLRKEMGLRGRDFANLVSVDNATLSRWENGKTKPSGKADRLIRILYAVKMKPAKELASMKLKAISPRQSEIPINLSFKRGDAPMLGYYERIHEWIGPATLDVPLRLSEKMMIEDESTCFEEITAADNYGYVLAA